MKKITDFFDIGEKRQTKVSVEILPILDILLIGLMLTLLGSKFLTAPGLAIELPNSIVQRQASRPVSAVLTISNANTFFFNGSVETFEGIGDAFRNHISTTGTPEPVLLVKAAREANAETLFKICEIARTAGFEHVQLAANGNKNEEQDVHAI